MLNNVFTRKIPNQVKWLFILVILPLYVYCGSLIGTAIIKFIMITFSLKLDYTTINCLLNLFFDFIMVIIVALMLKDTLIEQWRDFQKDIRGNLMYGCLIGVALIYGFGLIGGFITLMLGGKSSSDNQTLIESIVNVYPILMSISTVILAPILEEMLFRGIVFGWVYEINPKLAHVLSGFVFGFVHVMSSVLSGNMSEWIQIFAYFFMGVALSYLYEKRNNIFVPMMSHSIYNLISMLTILF